MPPLQIVGVHQFPIKPSGADVNENVVSEEAAAECGLSREMVRAAPPLAAAIGQFDRVAREELGGSVTLVTDGQLPLRQSLYPEAVRKNITLPSYYQRFHDLRKELAALVPGHAPRPTAAAAGEDDGEAAEEEEDGVEGMLRALELPSDPSPEPALRRARNMGRVLQRLVGEGGGPVRLTTDCYHTIAIARAIKLFVILSLP
jgi:epithelial splicing regulatory protein 1/2